MLIENSKTDFSFVGLFRSVVWIVLYIMTFHCSNHTTPTKMKIIQIFICYCMQQQKMKN